MLHPSDERTYQCVLSLLIVGTGGDHTPDVVDVGGPSSVRAGGRSSPA